MTGVYKGIDVSSHKRKIDWKKVKASGIDFAIIRAGYGEIYKDDYYEQNVNSAISNGIHVGAYYFIYAYDENSAKNNADNFIKLLKMFDGKFDMPVCCDFEYDSMRYMREMGVTPTKKLNTLIINTFCKRVQDAGYYVSNYLSLDMKENYVNDTSDYDLWLATWSYSAPPIYCNLWQYSSGGKVDGITGSVDMDYAYIDFPSLIKERGLNHTSGEPKYKVGDLVKVTKTNFSQDGYVYLLRADSYKILGTVDGLYEIGINNIPLARVNAKCIEKQEK